jgi:hypothetical protein
VYPSIEKLIAATFFECELPSLLGRGQKGFWPADQQGLVQQPARSVAKIAFVSLLATGIGATVCCVTANNSPDRQ